MPLSLSENRNEYPFSPIAFSISRFRIDSLCRARMPFVTSTRCTPTATFSLLLPPSLSPSPTSVPVVSADAKSGNVSTALRSMSQMSVPFPGPISTICTREGLPSVWYCVMSQTRSDSPNSCETSGAVMKSPPDPMTCSPPTCFVESPSSEWIASSSSSRSQSLSSSISVVSAATCSAAPTAAAPPADVVLPLPSLDPFPV
mmetsp:Transcript_21722/g.46505  ORF Transcript_21722/g.46505 Transcript_21722/m.46505 type:complete len:201 (-) Transcript_21722:1402-2004(-)